MEWIIELIHSPTVESSDHGIEEGLAILPEKSCRPGNHSELHSRRTNSWVQVKASCSKTGLQDSYILELRRPSIPPPSPPRSSVLTAPRIAHSSYSVRPNCAGQQNGEKMKKPWLVLVSAAVTLGAAVTSMAQTGNGAPNGAHYELGIIGVADPKTQPLTG